VKSEGKYVGFIKSEKLENTDGVLTEGNDRVILILEIYKQYGIIEWLIFNTRVFLLIIKKIN